tara:strand:- start:114 stop:284 length:171 start_codon:yes stop_codon:yes gene_type:complete
MTFRAAIAHSPEAANLIAQIEDCLASWDGRNRYRSILDNMVAELQALTGYRYELDN